MRESRSEPEVRVVAVGDVESRLKACEEALGYYALPETYWGIAMFGDAPHGDFFEDFEEYPYPAERDIRNNPGKRAREYFRQFYTTEDAQAADSKIVPLSAAVPESQQ